MIIGHRGASGYEPENTIRSFYKALDLGADGIEFDVRKSRDGIIVVIHDEKVDRTSNGFGCVSDFSFARLRELNFGKGELIPSFEEVLRIFGKKCSINVELKESNIGRDILDFINRFDLFDSIFVSSFSERWEEMLSLQKEESKLKVSFIVRDVFAANKALALAKQNNIFSINISMKLFLKHSLKTACLVKNIHADTKSLALAYPVNYRILASVLSNMGIDGFFSDFPDRV